VALDLVVGRGSPMRHRGGTWAVTKDDLISQSASEIEGD
jgi:hypothetical protein